VSNCCTEYVIKSLRGRRRKTIQKPHMRKTRRHAHTHTRALPASAHARARTLARKLFTRRAQTDSPMHPHMQTYTHMHANKLAVQTQPCQTVATNVCLSLCGASARPFKNHTRESTQACAHTNKCTKGRSPAQTNTHTHTCTYARTRTCTRTQAHTHTHKHAHASARALARKSLSLAHRHTYPHVHPHMQA